MTRLTIIKVILCFSSIGLGIWNKLLRNSFELPILSELDTTTVWIIAAIILAICIIINWTVKDY